MPINRIRPTLLSFLLFATLSACSAPEPEAVSGTEAITTWSSILPS